MSERILSWNILSNPEVATEEQRNAADLSYCVYGFSHKLAVSSNDMFCSQESKVKQSFVQLFKHTNAGTFH